MNPRGIFKETQFILLPSFLLQFSIFIISDTLLPSDLCICPTLVLEHFTFYLRFLFRRH